jgi:hypothetical protein
MYWCAVASAVMPRARLEPISVSPSSMSRIDTVTTGCRSATG